MAWRDNLVPASFRGVEFQIDGHESPIAGRRAANHEYPGRDENYWEDLGKRTKRFTFDAWVIGPGYMEQRDRLIEACDMPGPGELMHPYLGARMVGCDIADLAESTREGGMARFSLEFTLAGTNQNPTGRADTGAVVRERATSARSSLIDQFTSAWGL